MLRLLSGLPRVASQSRTNICSETLLLQVRSTNESNLDRDQVKQVQEALNQKGFKSGQADGKMGPETKDALQAFQQKQGLQATGQPDQQTLAALGINEAGTTGQAPAARAPAAKAPPVRARPI